MFQKNYSIKTNFTNKNTLKRTSSIEVKTETLKIVKKKVVIKDQKDNLQKPLFRNLDSKKNFNNVSNLNTPTPNINKVDKHLNTNTNQFKLDGEIFKKFLDHFANRAMNNMENIENSANNMNVINYQPIYNPNKLTIKSPRQKFSPTDSKTLKTTENYPPITGRHKGNNNDIFVLEEKKVNDFKKMRPRSEYKLYTNQINKIKDNFAGTSIDPSSRPITSLKESDNTIDSVSKRSEKLNTEKSLFTGRVNDYIMGKEIGKGAYAVVKQAVHKPSGMKLAIKIYEKFKLMDQSRKNAVKREIQILKQLDHPNIVKLYEIIDNPKQIWLVMELVQGVSLLSYLKSKPNRKLDEDACKQIFSQIVKGIDYLHSNNVYHRDIKLENIIIDDKNQIKIIDFGFGTWGPKSKLLNFFCGTPSYMPPEIVQKKDYIGAYADIWSIGILLFTLLCGSFPFRGLSEKELYSKIIKGAYIIPDYVSTEAKNLLQNILIVNPNNRYDSLNILTHDWLNLVSKEEIISK